MVPLPERRRRSTLMLGAASRASTSAPAPRCSSPSARDPLGFRDYIFRTGADDARASNNNIEFTIGTAMLF
jgi:hypothetical protein